MKVLVTGDREWDDIETIVRVLSKFPPGTILVHGACRGADNACAAVAESLGFDVRPYPANWALFPRGAGPIRNRQMLKSEHLPGEPIDFCAAFHNHIEDSRGTKDMLSCVVKAGIPHQLFTSTTQTLDLPT